MSTAIPTRELSKDTFHAQVLLKLSSEVQAISDKYGALIAFSATLTRNEPPIMEPGEAYGVHHIVKPRDLPEQQVQDRHYGFMVVGLLAHAFRLGLRSTGLTNVLMSALNHHAIAMKRRAEHD